MKNLELFLKELAELTKKYGLKIGGCGCCGSPWIQDFEGRFVYDDLNYDEETEKYGGRE